MKLNLSRVKHYILHWDHVYLDTQWRRII